MIPLTHAQLRDAADITGVLTPAALAVLHILFEEAEQITDEDMTEQDWQALGYAPLTRDTLVRTAIDLLQEGGMSVRYEEVDTAIDRLEHALFLSTEGEVVSLVLDLRAVGYRILHAIWPGLPRFAMEQQKEDITE